MGQRQVAQDAGRLKLACPRNKYQLSKGALPTGAILEAVCPEHTYIELSHGRATDIKSRHRSCPIGSRAKDSVLDAAGV